MRNSGCASEVLWSCIALHILLVDDVNLLRASRSYRWNMIVCVCIDSGGERCSSVGELVALATLATTYQCRRNRSAEQHSLVAMTSIWKESTRVT